MKAEFRATMPALVSVFFLLVVSCTTDVFALKWNLFRHKVPGPLDFEISYKTYYFDQKVRFSYALANCCDCY